jgi:hypothetical protein
MWHRVPGTPDMPDVVAALRAASTRLQPEDAGLKAENAELKAQPTEQAEKIARLERLVSRNSGFSELRVILRVRFPSASSGRRPA